MHTIEEDIERILISEKDIKKAVKKMGKQISKDYDGKNLMLVAVLKGSVIFMADLMRAISIPINIDFMSVSSYGGGTKTSGVVKILKDLDHDLSGKDILIVEDILDSGMTLSYLSNLLRQETFLPSESQPFLINPNAELRTLKRIISASPFRMNLLSVTVLTMTSSTAIFPISAFSNPKFTKNKIASLV